MEDPTITTNPDLAVAYVIADTQLGNRAIRVAYHLKEGQLDDARSSLEDLKDITHQVDDLMAKAGV